MMDPNTQQEQLLERSVEVSSPWFKMKLDDMDWKSVLVVAMILGTIVTIVYILHG